jgi:two-component system, NtrC family, response regulator HydG
MAGSFGTPPFSDPSIEARLEGLKMLAHFVDEPIVIFNPNMEMVYANPSADRVVGECPLLEPNVDPPAVQGGSQPVQCEPCPGKVLFEGFSGVENGPVAMTLPAMTANAHCPLPRAVPLATDEGSIRFAVMMGRHGRDSLVLPTDPRSRQPLDKMPQAGTVKVLPLIGESPPIQHLVEMIQLVAASEATVLIQGESGTGKELVAKTIHALSRRQSRPFVVVECSALPETLLESELFGHVRGAFTGAVSDRKGLFEEAEGGTIFLDEIADTSPAFQARLLRVLQEGEIRPVGSNRSIKIDVRVISAGNKPIGDLIKEKTFRADLYYRLAVLPLTVPPLRDRREDIPLLVNHFLTQSALKHNRLSLRISAEAETALVLHAWPGNVRELENLIERVVVTCTGPIIQSKDVFPQAAEDSNHSRNLTMIGKHARQEAERLRILEALREAKGDRTKAARMLKISRSSLYNKLRDYHLS